MFPALSPLYIQKNEYINFTFIRLINFLNKKPSYTFLLIFLSSLLNCLEMASKNPHHEGKEKEFDKNGKKITIPPEDLNIIWGRDNRYWKIQPNGEAELLQVCWLEVTGSVRGIDPTKSHRVSFNVSFTPDAFGWGVSPLYVMLKTGKAGKVKWEKVKIDTEKTKITGDSYPVENNSNDNSKLYFGLYEVWTGKWKGGLKIHNVIVEEV